jgi:hypothetical protein
MQCCAGACGGSWRRISSGKAAPLKDTGKPPPSTPNQVRDWLASILPPERLAQWPRTEKDQQLSIEGKHLKRLIGLPGTAPVLRMLAMEKLLSTFGPKLVEKLNPITGRLHPSFIISGAKSGRFACSHPNLQQLPSKRAPEFRRCIVASPGHVLIGCDWNQIELRAAGWISGDPELNEIYEQGLDLHKEMASQIAGVTLDQVTKDQRTAAKPVSFGAIYGIGPRSLAEDAFDNYDVEMSEAEAKDALEQFFNRFSVLNDWRQENYQRCQAEGLIRIGAGRVAEAAWEPGGRLTFPQCCNIPIQGICADAMLRAIALTHNRLIRARLDATLVATVHDELLLEARAEAGRDILHRSMVDAFDLTFPGAPTRGVAEVTIGRSWAELKDGAPAPAAAPPGASPAQVIPEIRTREVAELDAAVEIREVQPAATSRFNWATWEERFANYERVTGRLAHLHRNEETNWIEGYWLFNDYARHDRDYHGAYMRDLLKRWAALFFDRGGVLHVCSGTLKPDNPWLPGDTLDINPALNPTYCCNAETCDGVPLHLYDTVFIDPPYTEADAAKYGYPMLKRQRVLKTLIDGLPYGALIVWLDEIPPSWRKEWPIKWEAVWGIATSAGHRTRSVFVYWKFKP